MSDTQWTDDDEWPESSCDTMVCECDRCHEVKPCQRVIDPFVREGIVDRPAEHEWWCKPCWELRCGDV